MAAGPNHADTGAGLLPLRGCVFPAPWLLSPLSYQQAFHRVINNLFTSFGLADVCSLSLAWLFCWSSTAPRLRLSAAPRLLPGLLAVYRSEAASIPYSPAASVPLHLQADRIRDSVCLWPYSGAVVRVESISGTYATNFVCGKRIV